MSGEIYLTVKTVMLITGLFSWGYLTLLLMEITICKDARQINTVKLLQRPVHVRFKLLKRSLRSVFYRACAGMFIGSFIVTMNIIQQIWVGENKTINWCFFHLIFPISCAALFHVQGYYVTFFVRFKDFLAGKQD